MQCVINGLDLNRPIYKYIPLKYVVTMLKTQKLYVGKVKTWEDGGGCASGTACRLADRRGRDRRNRCL